MEAVPLKRMRSTIASKLYLSFGLMAVLLVGSAAFTLHDTNQSRVNYERLGENTRGAVLLAEAESALWRLRYGFPQFMVGDPAARAAILDEEPKWYKQIEDALNVYAGLDISQEERGALAALREIYKKYVEARPRWFDLYGSGNVEEAADWRAKTTTPFGAATIKSFDDLIALQQKMSAATRGAAEASAAIVRKVAILFISLALITAALIAHFITRSISTPMKQLVALTRGISKGDFTQRAKLERRDEFGTLSQGFDKMIDELALLVGEVQRSGIQVNTSVTEIAATAKQQQATANEIAATTTDIGPTSKAISATAKELVKTMDEVAGVAEKTAMLASSGRTGLSRMEAVEGAREFFLTTAARSGGRWSKCGWRTNQPESNSALDHFCCRGLLRLSEVALDFNLNRKEAR